MTKQYRPADPVSSQDEYIVVVGGVDASTGKPVALSVNSLGAVGALATAKRAFATVAASQTDSALVAAVTAKKIRVLGLLVMADSTATSITLRSKPGGAGTSISATLPLGVYGGLVLPKAEEGWFETASGEGLSVNTGGGAVSFQVLYAEV